MKNSWIGKLWCWLGFHLVVTTWGSDDGRYVAGTCLRCGDVWTFDNAHRMDVKEDSI